MKKIVIFLLVIVFSSIPISLYIYFSYYSKDVSADEFDNYTLNNDLFSYENNLEFEYYSDININSIITFSAGNLVDESAKLDTLKLGDNTFEFLYESNNETYRGEINYVVVDTTIPYTVVSNNYTILIGNEFDYSNIFCADNYDKRPNCYIEGDFDINSSGIYNLNFVATDSNNNVSSKNFTLTVKDEIIPSTSTYEPTPILVEDVINKHKNSDTMIGIDVSKWQEDIDWFNLKNSGIEFVIIRIGYGWEEIKLDEMFWNHYNGAKEAGLQIGIYFYSYADSVDESIMHAQWIIDTLDGIQLDLPISFDWEEWNKFNTYNISLTELNLMAEAFIDTIEENGYLGMNYGSASYLRNIWKIDDRLTWLAHYTDQTNYERDYYIWQLTHYGKIDGYDGFLDLNVLYLNK